MGSLVETALREKQVSSLWFRRILLLANLTPPYLIWLTHGANLWAWAYACIVHGLLLVGLLSPNSPLLGAILTRLPTQEKLVWLTIDDGPSPDTIPLAKMLASNGIQATFFQKGDALAAAPACLATLRQHGHSVANHTQHHPLGAFWIFPPSLVAHEIDAFQSTAEHLAAPLLPAFRCPAGVKNPFLHSILKKRGLTLVGWTVRAYDGVRCDPASSIQRIISRLTPGAILLVHEGKLDNQGAPASLEFIRLLITAVRRAGYDFASATAFREIPSTAISRSS